MQIFSFKQNRLVFRNLPEIKTIRGATEHLDKLDQKINKSSSINGKLRDEVNDIFKHIHKKIEKWRKIRLPRERKVRLNELQRKLFNLKNDSRNWGDFKDEYARESFSKTDHKSIKAAGNKLQKRFSNLIYKIEGNSVVVSRKDLAKMNKAIVKEGNAWKIEGTGKTMNISQAIRLANLLNYIEGLPFGNSAYWYIKNGKLMATRPLRDLTLLSKMPKELQDAGLTMQDLKSISVRSEQIESDREIDKLMAEAEFIKNPKGKDEIIFTLMNYVEGYANSAVMEKVDNSIAGVFFDRIYNYDKSEGGAVPRSVTFNAKERYRTLKGMNLPPAVIHTLMNYIHSNQQSASSSVTHGRMGDSYLSRNEKRPNGNKIPKHMVIRALKRYEYLKVKNLPDEVLYTLMNYREGSGASDVVISKGGRRLRMDDFSSLGHTVPDFVINNAQKRYKQLKGMNLPAIVKHTLMNYVVGRSYSAVTETKRGHGDVTTTGDIIPKHIIQNALKRYKYLKSKKLPDHVIYTLMNYIESKYDNYNSAVIGDRVEKRRTVKDSATGDVVPNRMMQNALRRYIDISRQLK